MGIAHTLSLQEHGPPVVLSAGDYSVHWRPALDVLVAHRIVRVRRASEHVLVYANQFSGVCRSPGGVIRIAPRHPHVTRELSVRYSRSARTTPLDAYDPAGAAQRGRDRAAQVLSSLNRVVDRGVPFRFESREHVSANLSGTLDLTETVSRLMSRGINHLAVVRRKHRVPVADFADSANSMANYLSDYQLLGPTESRQLSRLLDAIGSSGRVLVRPELERSLMALAAAETERPEIGQYVNAASTLLADNLPDANVEYSSGRVSFRFIDSDALWERAVNDCLDSIPEVRSTLHPLRGTSTPRYPDGGPDLDPDVVTLHRDVRLLIADAKDYEADAADSSAVYQVDNYARYLGVRHAALFYLSMGDDWTESYGDSEVRVHAFGVRATEPGVLARLRAACAHVVATASG